MVATFGSWPLFPFYCDPSCEKQITSDEDTSGCTGPLKDPAGIVCQVEMDCFFCFLFLFCNVYNKWGDILCVYGKHNVAYKLQALKENSLHHFLLYYSLLLSISLNYLRNLFGPSMHGWQTVIHHFGCNMYLDAKCNIVTVCPLSTKVNGQLERFVLCVD